MKLTTKELVRISIAIALIAVGAQIKVPSPLSGYFTLQLPMIIMISTILGSRNAVITTLVYVVGGLIGIPWFASGGGITYLAMPTFGFILAFIVAAAVAGIGGKHEKISKGILFSTIATLLVWLIGMVYMTMFNQLYFGKTVSYVAAIVSIFSLDLVMDLVLAYFATTAGFKIRKIVGR